MKQVVFAIALLAMASLTGCLNTDDTSVDENTDTTSDNNDGLIDPVDGVTIPKDSSIFMDSMGSSVSWDCSYTGDEDGVCGYEYITADGFISTYNDDETLRYIQYKDSDGITNQLDFNGWVNKTGKTVTIESLNYPDRASNLVQYNYDGDGEIYYTEYQHHYGPRFVTSSCNGGADCEITFYGNGGLTYNGFFTMSEMQYWNYDTDNSRVYVHYYVPITLVFELPFEPYGFTLTQVNSNGQVDRIF